MHYIKRTRWTAIRFKVVAILFKILPLKKFRIIYLWSIKRIIEYSFMYIHTMKLSALILLSLPNE